MLVITDPPDTWSPALDFPWRFVERSKEDAG